MPRFFINQVPEESVWITGEDARHITRSLRMKPGEKVILCDSLGIDYHGEIVSVALDRVQVKVLSFCETVAEPSVFVTLYQGLPKSDKMDHIVQKSVECGVSRIVPIQTARCISRPDTKSAAKKQERWQKIAEEAAKQSGRGVIPAVSEVTDFKAAVKQAAGQGEILFFYEGGGEGIARLVRPATKNLSIFIGPEGGFEAAEVEFAQQFAAKTATLGPRILRTETAPIAALAAIMLATGNME